MAVRLFFSKNDFNDILRLAFGHKETNRGNVHIVCKSRLSPRQEFVPQNLKSTLFLFPETGTTTNLTRCEMDWDDYEVSNQVE